MIPRGHSDRDSHRSGQWSGRHGSIRNDFVGHHRYSRRHDDRLRLGVHIGSGYGRHVYSPGYSSYSRHPVYTYDRCGNRILGYSTHRHTDWPPGYDGVYYGSRYRYGAYPITGEYLTLDPALVQTYRGGSERTAQAEPTPPPEPPRPLTPLEIADAHLQTGRTADAMKGYEAYLDEHPEDAGALRSLGIAMVIDGQLKEGVATIAHAYRTDPALADRPMRAVSFPRGEGGLHRLVSTTVRHAHEVKSASSWLAVGVLMQAQGRPGQAGKMIARAEAAGLEAAVADRLELALAR